MLLALRQVEPSKPEGMRQYRNAFSLLSRQVYGLVFLLRHPKPTA